MEYFFIIVAMKSEANDLLKKIKVEETKNLFNYEIYLGKYNDINIILGISGVGPINISGLIHVVMLNYKIKFILNYGVVGGHGLDIHKGDLVVTTECLNGSSFITKKTGKGEGINLNNRKYQTFIETLDDILIIEKMDNNIIEKIKEIEMDKSIKIYYGRIYSGEQWNREYDTIMFLHKNYKTLCEDMEAYAVFYNSNKYKIPFAVVKGVSNNEILNEEYDYTVMDNLLKFVEKVIIKLN